MAQNEHQKAQRQETLDAVDEAAKRLTQEGVKLTLRTIAEEAELSVGTVSKPQVKMYLMQKYRLGEKFPTDEAEIKDLQLRIAILEEKVKKERASAVKANERANRMQAERDAWELKWRNLALKYAMEIDKKTVPI